MNSFTRYSKINSTFAGFLTGKLFDGKTKFKLFKLEMLSQSLYFKFITKDDYKCVNQDPPQRLTCYFYF